MATHSDFCQATLASRTAGTAFEVGTINVPVPGTTIKAIVVDLVDDPGVSAVSVMAAMTLEFTSSVAHFPGPPQKYVAPSFMSAPAATNPAIANRGNPFVIPVNWPNLGTGDITVKATSWTDKPTGGDIRVGLIWDD